jgi:hypothetical protein
VKSSRHPPDFQGWGEGVAHIITGWIFVAPGAFVCSLAVVLLIPRGRFIASCAVGLVASLLFAAYLPPDGFLGYLVLSLPPAAVGSFLAWSVTWLAFVGVPAMRSPRSRAGAGALSEFIVGIVSGWLPPDRKGRLRFGVQIAVLVLLLFLVLRTMCAAA